MKKVLFILFVFIGLFTQAQQDSISSQISNLGALMPYWNEYVQVCNNDSTLQIWWQYTGQEKPQQSIDTTIVKGVESKVITIVPTVQQQWVKETPTLEGLKKYLENKKNPEDGTTKMIKN